MPLKLFLPLSWCKFSQGRLLKYRFFSSVISFFYTIFVCNFYKHIFFQTYLSQITFVLDLCGYLIRKRGKNGLNGFISELLSGVQTSPIYLYSMVNLTSLFITLHWMLEDDASWTFQTIKSGSQIIYQSCILCWKAMNNTFFPNCESFSPEKVWSIYAWLSRWKWDFLSPWLIHHLPRVFLVLLENWQRGIGSFSSTIQKLWERDIP